MRVLSLFERIFFVWETMKDGVLRCGFVNDGIFLLLCGNENDGTK